MKEIYADPVIGIAGLLFFFALFMGILIWVFRPGAKEKFQKHADIPLEDDKNDN